MLEHLSVAEHTGQSVVEIMRDASGQGAHGLHPLGGLKLFFHLSLLRDVVGHSTHTGKVAPSVAQLRNKPFAVDCLSVLAEIGVQRVIRVVDLDYFREDPADMGLRLRNHEKLEWMLSLHLILRPPEYSLCRRVPSNHAAFLVKGNVAEGHLPIVDG